MLARKLLIVVISLGLLFASATVPSTAATEIGTETPIMQQPRLSPAQMAAWFNEASPGGYAATVPVEFLAAFFAFEGAAEGVSGDIAFIQSILETSWFRFPSYGQVRASYNNFGGIGACDGGTCSVARFRSARIGVRAQIQHLRAYADPTVTEANLTYPLESPRFELVLPKGRAPNWDDMGGGNWATDPLYAPKILALYVSMVRFADENPQLTGTWLFDDVPEGSLFEHDIIRIAVDGTTRGCGTSRYCPTEPVSREQMAAFLVRSLGLTASSGVRFKDVAAGSTFERDIDRLATAGITRGCNPPANDRFCPDDPVTREQMAAFLVRAGRLADASGTRFRDVATDSIFVGDIDRLATAGITRGCNPPANDRFCPTDAVTREQMAAFLVRSFSSR